MVTVAACVVALAVPAQVQELQAIKDDIAGTGVKLQTLVVDYGDAEILKGVRSFSERLTDAEILFLLADYQRASLVLFDLVSSTENEGEALYGKAIYYLADSQFQMGNDLAARSYFQKIVARRDRENLIHAIRRLIEIADRTRNWSGLEEYISVLRTRGKLPPTIAYITTKSFLRQGKLAEVEVAASDIPEVHPIYPKARYLVGVAKLRAGDIEAARAIFATLAKTPDEFDDAEAIRDLARMNQARLFMERGRLSEAIDAYQDVERVSNYFEESLYEITWTYVRSAVGVEDEKTRIAQYAKALKALEILLLSETGTTLAPEARILLGNILLRLGRFEEATAAFSEVVERYEPVRRELQSLAVEVTDPIQYYDDIARRSRAGGGLLPPLAIKWAAEQRELQQALGVVQDIDQGEAWIDESRTIVEKLLAILNSEKRAQFFPALHDAQVGLLELENTLISLSYRLLTVERNIVGAELDPIRAEALERVLAEREQLEPGYRKLPKKKEDYEGRLETMRGRMMDLQKRAFRLKWDVEEMRRSVDALRAWMVDNPIAMSEEDAAELRSRLGQVDREVVQLEGLQRELEGVIAKERGLITITTDEEAAEEVLRARYAATLDKERDILAIGSIAVFGDQRKILDQVETQQGVIARFHADLENFRARLSQLVGDKAQGIKVKLLREQSLLEVHEKAIAATRDDAKRVVGEIAIESLRGVERNFESIVLRGDVGIVDVAWALKEQKTHQISKRVNEQRKELTVLDAEFRGIGDE